MHMISFTHSRLKPVNKLDNVRVLESLEHIQLVVHHALVALDIFLEDNLNSHLAVRAVRLPDDTVCACA